MPQSTPTIIKDGNILRVKGRWSLENLNSVEHKLGIIKDDIFLDGSDLELLDTSGAEYLLRTLEAAGAAAPYRLKNFSERASNIFQIVQAGGEQKTKHLKVQTGNLVEAIGRTAEDKFKNSLQLIGFGGETLVSFFLAFSRGRSIRFRELVIQLERAGIKAIPIVALVTFLIGIVLAYLFAGQSEKYGTSIFVVEAVSMGMTRELSPIIAAIIVAGRSGSAFTAQIGTMRLNQETDAITVMGLSPMDVLVIPRVLALIITLPFLVFIGDLAGIAGGMLVADLSLSISPSTFIERMQLRLPLRFVWLGLLKAPVFALFIGLIGCYRGLSVERNSLSVGLNTTATVVQSIVTVILLNAAFAVIFQELRL